MLIVVGSIYSLTTCKVSVFPVAGKTSSASDIHILPYGDALAQSLAAVRWGDRVALVGRAGDDGKTRGMIARVRRQGVMTSGVVESDTPTGAIIEMYDGEGQCSVLRYEGANAGVSPVQVPEEVLVPGNILMIQSGLTKDTIDEILQKSKNCGASNVMVVSSDAGFYKGAMEMLDYIVSLEDDFSLISREFGCSLDGGLVSMVSSVASVSNVTCAVIGNNGEVVVVTPDGEGWTVSVNELPDGASAECKFSREAFAGTFAASLCEDGNLEQAVRVACSAMTVCDGEDPVHCFAYRDVVERCAESSVRSEEI